MLPHPTYGEWYKGDLHAHSRYSDGDSSLVEIISRVEGLGLDFFALTDHDTFLAGEPSYWSDPDYCSNVVVLLYGVEWTTPLGHANIISDAPFSYSSLWQANLDLDVKRALENAHREDALFSINHPAAFLCCPWCYQIYEGIDCLEVWNSMFSLPNFNRLAVSAIWDELLKTGRRITGVGGSDTHHLVEWQSLFLGIGNPTTWVHAEELTAEGILTGIRAGAVTISYAPHAPRLDFTADRDGDGNYETKVGEVLSLEPGQEISFRVDTVYFLDQKKASGGEVWEVNPTLMVDPGRGGCLPQGLPNLREERDKEEYSDYFVAVIKNGLLFKTWLGRGAFSITFKDVTNSGSPSYYRVELWGIPEVSPLFFPFYGSEIALTNPIYVNY